MQAHSEPQAKKIILQYNKCADIMSEDKLDAWRAINTQCHSPLPPYYILKIFLGQFCDCLKRHGEMSAKC